MIDFLSLCMFKIVTMNSNRCAPCVTCRSIADVALKDPSRHFSRFIQYLHLKLFQHGWWRIWKYYRAIENNLRIYLETNIQNIVATSESHNGCCQIKVLYLFVDLRNIFNILTDFMYGVKYAQVWNYFSQCTKHLIYSNTHLSKMGTAKLISNIVHVSSNSYHEYYLYLHYNQSSLLPWYHRSAAMLSVECLM